MQTASAFKEIPCFVLGVGTHEKNGREVIIELDYRQTGCHCIISLHFCVWFATLTLESLLHCMYHCLPHLPYLPQARELVNKGHFQRTRWAVGVGSRWGYRMWATYRCLWCTWNSWHIIGTKQRNRSSGGCMCPFSGSPSTWSTSNAFPLMPLDHNQQRSILGPLNENSGGQVAASLRMWHDMLDPWMN